MNYEDIFEQRGGSYHEAMTRWPDARREDFLQPLKWLHLRPGEKLIDVPAGGGYLARHVPDACRWFGHEPCASFLSGSAKLDTTLLPLPFADAIFDAAISIAGVHHINDKRALFHELKRVIKPSARLLLADVHVDSDVARFLDDFVGRHTSTGHDGIYLSRETAFDLQACGFSIVRSERVRYAWWFADRAELGTFCRLLFDMRDISGAEVASAVENTLGVQTRNGKVGMNWELFFLLAAPSAGLDD